MTTTTANALQEAWRAKPKLAKRYLAQLELKRGAHGDRDNGLCAMEAVAWLAGEPHSDRPDCTCPVIGTFLRSWNDALPNDEERGRILKPLLVIAIGTKADKEIETRRAFMCIDWTVRTFTPTWLDLCNKTRYAVHVEALRHLPEVTGREGLIAATPVLVAAQKEAAAARAAAWTAARTAARDAAMAAAMAAARAAAWAAAWDAAMAAAMAAARAAARDAARDALKSVKESLQKYAADLVRRMCETK